MDDEREAMVSEYPEGHPIVWTRENYGMDFSDCSIDCDGGPMYESGLYCTSCNRVYGLGKLKEFKRK